MPRFVARIPFNAENLDGAKRFARKIRRVARDHADTADEWAERDARLLRVQEPDNGLTPVDPTYASDSD